MDRYAATLVHWPLMREMLHLVQRGEAWAGCGPAQSPPRYQMEQPTHQRPVYQLHIIRCGTIITLALQRVN